MNRTIKEKDFSIIPYITKKELKIRIKQLAQEISNKYKDEELVIIGLLKGCIIFFTDLIRELDIDKLKIDFIKISSYGDGQESGDIKIESQAKEYVKDKNVLVIDDILETGKSMYNIIDLLEKNKPKNIETCFLLHKDKTLYDVPQNYIGFEIDDKFIVGYGLDYKGYYRNLEYIGILKEK